MPNWCMNILTVKGSKEALAKFKDFAKAKKENKDIGVAIDRGDLSLHNFLPYPQQFIDINNRCSEIDEKIKKGELSENASIKDGYNQGGYEWCVKNWGTKWDAVAGLVTDTDEELIYQFDSAWSPPLPVVLVMGKMFPELAFELAYEEPGMCFKGIYKVERGVETVNECADYVPDIDIEEK